jgi:GntR family transcriptional regulator
LRVNRNTVARAYSELEREGIVESVAGKGCFVRAVSSPYRKDVRRRLVGEALEDAVAHAHQLQIDREDFLALARERYDQCAQQRARASR